MAVDYAYVPSSRYPFVELQVVEHCGTNGERWSEYVLRAYSIKGSPRMPKRTEDPSHARTFWIEATRGLELAEDAI